MKIIQQHADLEVKLILEGELTLESCPELEPVLKKVVEGKPKSVIVDMRKVDYVDSSGLRLFVDYHHQLSYLQGKLVLVGLTQNVKKVLEVTRLNQVLTIQDETHSDHS